MSRGIIYTLGTSTRPTEEFLALLVGFGIERVVDVRRFPTSRFDHFRAEELARLLEERGIDYLPLGEKLGGYRAKGYEAYMGSPEFEAGIRELEAVAGEGGVAILCAERLPWRCHRRFIGRELASRGWRVIHIIDGRRQWAPQEP